LASSLKTITKPEWVYKSTGGDYEFSLSIIGNDILWSKSSGYTHKDDIIKAEQVIQQALDEFFPDDSPFYFISDVKDTTGASTNARNEHLNYRLKQIEKTTLLLYSAPKTVLKIIVKAGKLFPAQLRAKVNISKDLDHALSIIDKHRVKTLIDSNQSAGSEKPSDNKDNISDLPEDKEELKALVNKLQNEKQKQYKTLFNNIPDAVFLHDMKTHAFVDFNDRALKYGYTKEELLKMTPYDLHPPGDMKKVNKNIGVKNETPGTSNRYTHVMKDDTKIAVEILSSEIEYNGKSTWISIVRDITARKNFEKALIKKQKEAEAASKAKSEFLANMSHEIRTPMNGVIGMLDLLLETALSEDQYEFAASAQQSADSLLILINDILDFAKIEARKLEIEIIDFDLSITLDSLSDLLSIKAFEKGIDFSCLVENNVPLLLKGDPSRLRQILSNLADNAIKFTSKGEVFIKVSVNKETNNKVTLLFEVIDTGIGIPKGRLDKLFEPFTQADTSTTRKYGGTGLGLAISKQLTELMGGKASLESESGKGSNFYFTIVFEKQTNVKQEIILFNEIKETKILVVDDSHTNHQIFKEYLKSWECLFDIVDNYNDALLMLKKAAKTKNPYKLALIDMEMPEMSGQELGSAIKIHKDIQDTILIMLSSSAKRGDAKKLKKIGFAGFLTKPIKKIKLFDTLRAVLSVGSQNLFQSTDPIITSYKVEEMKKAQAKINPILNILLVEDNKVNQFVAKKMLQNVTKGITIANNGKEAVDLFLKNNFDIIFMDIQMPVMDGTEAITIIRDFENKNGSHTPIIVLTANAMKGDRERFLAVGADGYLTKPMKKETLFKEMKSLGLI
jgi:PAS domain S-box-containing protein